MALALAPLAALGSLAFVLSHASSPALALGFAILENMLYQGLYAQAKGCTWDGITPLPGIGAVMHPSCSGLRALGWYGRRERRVGAWGKALGLAIGIHTPWNDGFDV